jgi:polysaccharide pyruvyl transferase WcaK-like protein
MEVYEGDLGGFIQRFAQADAHVACRLHSAILAYLLDLPFTALVYHEKVRAFATETGLRSECVLDPDEFATDDFARSVEAVLRKPVGETRAPRDVGSEAAAHVNAVAELISGAEGRARSRSLLGRRVRS